MRLKAILLITALGATALPATAQAYRDDCRRERGNNQAGGAILGSGPGRSPRIESGRERPPARRNRGRRGLGRAGRLRNRAQFDEL